MQFSFERGRTGTMGSSGAGPSLVLMKCPVRVSAGLVVQVACEAVKPVFVKHGSRFTVICQPYLHYAKGGWGGKFNRLLVQSGGDTA